MPGCRGWSLSLPHPSTVMSSSDPGLYTITTRQWFSGFSRSEKNLSSVSTQEPLVLGSKGHREIRSPRQESAAHPSQGRADPAIPFPTHLWKEKKERTTEPALPLSSLLPCTSPLPPCCPSPVLARSACLHRFQKPPGCATTRGAFLTVPLCKIH